MGLTMASFPELLKFRSLLTSPVMPGLLDRVPQAPQMPQAPRPPRMGNGNALGAIFGGVDDPRLSPEENRRARQQAIMQAGLATLASGNPNGLQAVAQGAMAGQQAGAQGRAGTLEQRQTALEQQQTLQTQQAIQQAMQGPGEMLPKLYELFKIAAATGNSQLGTAVATLIQAREATERDAAGGGLPRAPVRGTPEWLESRRQELELERQYAPPRAPMPGTPEYYADLEQRAQIAAKYRPAPRTAAGSEGERKAAAFTGMVNDGRTFIDTIETAPGRVEQALSDKGIREFTDDEQQRLQLAGNALAEAWLRMTTGAAYNEREFNNAYNLFVPRPGDRKAALDWKKNNRARLAEMIRTHSGRLAPAEEPEAAVPEDPFADLVPR